MNLDKFVGHKIYLGTYDEPLELCTVIRIIASDDDDECVEIERSDGYIEAVTAEDIVQVFPKVQYENPDSLYYYVIFRYGKTERSKQHIYMSMDSSIVPGDLVNIADDFYKVGNVIKTGYYTKATAPYPVDKTWNNLYKARAAIDFLEYEDADKTINADNDYVKRLASHECRKPKFITNPQTTYAFEAANFDGHYEWFYNEMFKKAPSVEDVISFMYTELEYQDYWEENEENQLESFYKTLWLVSFFTRHGITDKKSIDKLICLKLIYSHGDFDEFMYRKADDKEAIEKALLELENII